MTRTSRFLYTHKLLIFNVLLFIYVLAMDPELYNISVGHESYFHFGLGVLLVFSLFLEYAAIISKTKFIYSHRNYSKKKIPVWLRLLFFPRLVIFGAILALAFRGLGMLESADWLVIIIVLYATVKELWVRGTLMNVEFEVKEKIPSWRVLSGEILFFLFKMVAYLGLWELFLIETPKILKRAIQPQNYVIVAPIFLLFTISVMLPYLVEENFREKRKSQKVISYLSLLLPTVAFILQLMRLKYMPDLWG